MATPISKKRKVSKILIPYITACLIAMNLGLLSTVQVSIENFDYVEFDPNLIATTWSSVNINVCMF